MAEPLVGATGAEVLVTALRAHGVEVVLGIPGTHNLAVFDALRRTGIRVVATTHEQGAGYAADGYARTARRPGVAVVTTGPGVLNAATAVAQAYSDSSPVLLVSPGMPSGLPTGGPGTGVLHEAKDQQGAMERIAATSLRPTTHQGIADAVAQGYAVLTGGRPRPVHLEVPIDLLERTGDAVVDVHRPAPPAAPDPEQVRRAAALLHGAQRPFVVAGGGAAGAARELTALVELLGSPVVTTVNGAGVLPPEHPLALGARLPSSAVAAAVADSDALLVVGSELGPSDLWHGPLRPGGPVVRLDVDPAMADMNLRSDVALLGDAAVVLDAVREQLGERAAVGAPAYVDALRRRLDDEARRTGARWLPWLDALAAALDDDAVLATDNAMGVYYGVIPVLGARRPASLHFPTGFGTLGFAVPVALGAALAAPQRQVVAVTGDGGLLFTVTELATLAAEGLPVAVVVLDNGGYGEIRQEMLDRGEQPVAVDAPPRDLVVLARALGAHAVRATDPDDLAAQVRAARHRAGPTVVVVPEATRATPTETEEAP